MNRISVLNESKFERMSIEELRSTKGGFCLSCKKRTRKVELGCAVKAKVVIKGQELEVTVS